MNSDTVIKVEGLSKKYRLGSPTKYKYKALRDVITGIFTAPFQGRVKRKEKDFIWALKNMSFEVKRGEVVGIIGRNGAGKTTLLKILSRITPPTEGYARIRGRVGSLLEVGTGFHPELTGRENIYLSGAILGMKKREIDKKFDEIVDFSELEKFLDTPVKFYSSGMFVRLAFAVAAHLEPEILLVDEVLAVGDAAFQKKCLGKMGDVAKEGRTVLFVSHNMGAIQNLCERAILLDLGRIRADGSTESVIRRYLESFQDNVSQDLSSRKDRRGRGRVRFTRIYFEDGKGNPVDQGVSGQPLIIVLEYECADSRPLRNCRISVAVHDSVGQVLFNCSSELTNKEVINLPPKGKIRCVIPQLPLSQSRYLVSPFFEVNREIEDWIQGAAVLNVVDGDFFGTGKLYPEGWRGKGVIVPHRWILDSRAG